MKLGPLQDFLSTRAWAMEERILEQLTGVVMRHAQGVKLPPDEIAAIVAARDERDLRADLDDDDGGRRGKRSYTIAGGVAVIPIRGVIARHASMVNGSSQARGTAVETLRASLRDALAEKRVKAILLDVDSPGGSTDGVNDLAAEIHASRGKKPIWAIAGGGMHSAAYYLASQADRLIAETSSGVGSIGVYMVVHDLSAKAAMEGVKVNVVKAGRLKGVGVPGAPISEEALAMAQDYVNAHYEQFVDAVARGRGITRAKALDLADGRFHAADRALKLGLVDAIGTFESVLDELGTARAPSARATHAETNIAEPDHVALGDVPPASAATEGEEMTTPTNPATAASAPTRTAEDTAREQALRAEGAQQERVRVTAIRALAAPGQEALCASLIETGATEAQALAQFHADLKRSNGDMLAKLRANTETAVGTTDVDPLKAGGAQKPVTTSGGPVISADAEVKNLEARWSADPDFRDQFGGDFDACKTHYEMRRKGMFVDSAKTAALEAARAGGAK